MARQANRLPRSTSTSLPPITQHHLLKKALLTRPIKDPADSCTTSQLAALDTQITHLRTQTTQLTATAKVLRSTLASLTSELSTAELIANVHALETEKTEIETRLYSLRAGKAKKVTKEQRERVEREWKKSVSVARKRERIVRDMWRFVEDQVLEKEEREELRERLGLDE